MDTRYQILVKLLQSGTKIQTGSMLFTNGSVPQVPGAMAIFEQEKVISGTLGGGLLEAEAQKEAALSSKNNKSCLKSIQFNADMADESGAICGGSALFFIDANPAQHLNTYLQLINSISHYKHGALVTLFRKTKLQNLLIERFWIEQNNSFPEIFLELIKAEKIDIQKIIQSRKPFWIESINNKENRSGENTSVFIEPIYPTPQLIIVGAGHVGQALYSIASLVDFETIVVDDRPEQTITSRFPEASQIICAPLNKAFRQIQITAESYILIATQGHRKDMEALKYCIGSNAAYIGVIGSKRKIALVEQEFIAKKWATTDEWNFVHAPVGIDIHSKSVNEIAISIVAELVKERYEINFQRIKKKVSSIVLAAGKSTRMGSQKLLLPFEGESMVKFIVDKIARSNSNQTLVVIGSHKNEIKDALKDCKVIFVENERFEEGMLSSVQAGVEFVTNETDGMLIILGDQPMISEVVINRLISGFQKTEKGLLVPTFNGKRGHPVLISSKYKNSIKSINPEIGLRELFLNNANDILEIEVEFEGILKDIDTQEDYKRETRNKYNS